MKKYNLYLIHGFLGESKDWDSLKKEIKNLPINKIYTIDLFSPDSPDRTNGFKEFVDNFEHHKDSAKNILMGYSLGGRLALHLAMKNPNFWDEVVLLSANPGWCEDVSARKLWEKSWSDRLKEDPWDRTLKAWNELEIFKHCTPRIRSEKDFSRQKLCGALRNWSLTKHMFKPEDLKTIDVPLHWLCGERDIKYSNLMEKSKNEAILRSYTVIPEKGHRLIEASQQLAQFLAKLMK